MAWPLTCALHLDQSFKLALYYSHKLLLYTHPDSSKLHRSHIVVLLRLLQVGVSLRVLWRYSDATVTGATPHAVAAEYPQSLMVPTKVLRIAVVTAVLCYMIPTYDSQSGFVPNLIRLKRFKYHFHKYLTLHRVHIQAGILCKETERKKGRFEPYIITPHWIELAEAHHKRIFAKGGMKKKRGCWLVDRLVKDLEMGSLHSSGYIPASKSSGLELYTKLLRALI